MKKIAERKRCFRSAALFVTISKEREEKEITKTFK